MAPVASSQNADLIAIRVTSWLTRSPEAASRDPRPPRATEESKGVPRHPKGAQKAPKGRPRHPKVSPRAPQRKPKAPKAVPKEGQGTAKETQKKPQAQYIYIYIYIYITKLPINRPSGRYVNIII